MSLLARLFRRGPELAPEHQRRLQAWQQLPPADLDSPSARTRHVVVDVESTGLDLNRDQLIAIGAVAVQGDQIVLADSFEVVLRQDQASAKDNILIHGIGGEAQREGEPPVQALLAFLDFLGKSPLVAFHVTFDETMIKRALRSFLGLDFKHPWVDLAYVLPALLPEYAQRYRALDEWAGHFAINNYARHSALADALATAQLLQCVLKRASSRQANSYRQLQNLEQARRWVSWSN